MAGSHLEPAQISELGDAYKVRIRCLHGNVECGQPRKVWASSLWDSRAEVLAGSDAVVQHASLTDLGLCEDAPNADTAKLSDLFVSNFEWLGTYRVYSRALDGRPNLLQYPSRDVTKRVRV